MRKFKEDIQLNKMVNGLPLLSNYLIICQLFPL